jgi:hypothetical protein
MIAYEKDERPADYEELLGLIDAEIELQPPLPNRPTGKLSSGPVITAMSPTTSLPGAAGAPRNPRSAPAVRVIAPVEPPPPPKRSRVGLVVGIVLAVLLVPVLLMAASLFLAVGRVRVTPISSPDPSPPARVIPTPPPRPSPAATAAALEPRGVVLEEGPAYFKKADKLTDGWTPTPAAGWRAPDVNSDLTADLLAVLEGEGTLATLTLDQLPEHDWCLKAELYPLNVPEVGGFVEAGGQTARFALQPLGGSSLFLRMVKAGDPDETVDSLTLAVPALGAAPPEPVEIRLQVTDGVLWGRVVGAAGATKDKQPKAWVRIPLAGPVTKLGLYAKRGATGKQVAAAFSSVKLAVAQ